MPQAGEEVPGPLEGALQCGIMAGTAGKRLRHCWSRCASACADVTRPEQQLELAEPVQGLTQGAGLVHGWTGSQ